MLDRFLISVFSGNKKADDFLKMPDCFLISVDRAFILVFFARKQADRFFISVIRVFILVFSASKKADYFLKMPDRFLISVDRALTTIIAFVAKVITDLPKFSQDNRYKSFLT